MKTLALIILSLFLNIATAAENVPSPEFKRRWLNLMGCWENTKVGEYWCNAPIHGPNIRDTLYALQWNIRLLEGNAAGPENMCMRLGEWNSRFHAVGFLIKDVAEMDNVSANIKWAIDMLSWQIGGDNTYVYWTPIESYCVEGRAEYRDKKLLLANLKRMQKEMFFGPGQLNAYGIVAAFKGVNALMGLDMPFDKDL